MLARVLLTAFSFVACVSAAHAQLPPDSVILSKVKISEKQKSVDLCPVHLVPSVKALPTWTYKGVEYRGHTPRCQAEFEKDANKYVAAARAQRWENNFASAMSTIWCPVTDEVNAGGGRQWERLGLTWESCCKFCDDGFAEDDFTFALDELKARAKVSYKATGGKYVEGAKSPVEGAIKAPPPEESEESPAEDGTGGLESSPDVGAGTGPSEGAGAGAGADPSGGGGGGGGAIHILFQCD